MSKLTFKERCAISEQCLPDAPYRDMLTKLHGEMLAELARGIRVGLELEIAAAVLDHCYGYGGVNDDMIERATEVVKAKLHGEMLAELARGIRVGLEREIAAALLDHCYGYGGVNDDMIERATEVVKAKLREQKDGAA
jgi:uncharacterized membrane protein